MPTNATLKSDENASNLVCKNSRSAQQPVNQITYLYSKVFGIWQRHHSFGGIYTEYSVDNVSTDSFQQVATQLHLEIIYAQTLWHIQFHVSTITS